MCCVSVKCVRRGYTWIGLDVALLVQRTLRVTAQMRITRTHASAPLAAARTLYSTALVREASDVLWGAANAPMYSTRNIVLGSEEALHFPCTHVPLARATKHRFIQHVACPHEPPLCNTG